MLESLVSTLLNRFLGAYVSNLNYNQLQIGIWSGEVVLRDLKLKREALDKLNLPVDVLEGYLGELTLNIPWSNLKNKPVVVYIKDVHVLAVPRNESTMTAEEIESRQYEAKMRKLADAELVQSSISSEQQEQMDVKNDTFVNQLVAKIMNNLQLSVTNIHVRYEDNMSVPGHRFATGITLSELSAITTDENWMPKTIEDLVNVIHKLATLESLSIYWNTDARSLGQLNEQESKKEFQQLIATKSFIPDEHQYILKPVSGTGRIKLNKSFGNKVPKVDATLLFDELAFMVDNEQYRDVILMLDLFHSYLKKQKYQHLHPSSDMTPKRNPREFFKFAGNAVLAEIHERNARWSWNRLKERRDDRHAYLDCYVADKLGRATEDRVKQLEKLERKLSYEDILFYRGIAKSQLKREKALMAAEEKQRKELEAATKATQQTQQGWLSSWWYGQTSAGANDDKSDGDLMITEEQKQEFYDAIEYDEDKAAIAESIEIPKDTILLQLRTSLNKGSFTLKRNPHAKNPSELVSLVFNSVMLGSTLYVESWKASAALGDLCLYDGVTENTNYRQLVGVSHKMGAMNNQRESKGQGDIGIDGVQLENKNLLAGKNPFFMEYEYRPLDKRADNAISLIMRDIDIVYNPLIIGEIFAFFRPPETSIDSINALVEAAGDALEDIQQKRLPQNIRIDLFLDSINFILNNDGIRIATGELSHGELLILLMGDKIKVQSKFANFTLTDDSKKPLQNQDKQFNGDQILTIQGEELIDLSYETFQKPSLDAKDDHSYPGYDQSLYLRMGSAQFTFLEKPVCNLLSFFSKSAAMKAFYDRARQAAVETAQQQYNTTTKTHFDIVIRTPVVLFPELQRQHPMDVVVAHLGEIWASNSFIEESDGCMNHIRSGLRDMHLTSKWHYTNIGGNDKQVQLQTLPIIDNIDLNFDTIIPHIKDNQYQKRSDGTIRPGVEVVGDLSRVSMNLTERQYSFLLEATQMASRILGKIQQQDDQTTMDRDEYQESNHFNRPENTVKTPPESSLVQRQQQDKRVFDVEQQTVQEKSEDQTPSRLRFQMSFRIPAIEFEVYTEKTDILLYKRPISIVPISLSKFALNGSSISVLGQENGSMNIKWQVRALTVDDTRPNIRSKFKNIVPPIQHGNQFVLLCDISPPPTPESGANRHGIVLVTINEPKMIVSLDHVFMLYQFFTAPISRNNSNKKPPPLPPRTSQQQQQQQQQRRRSSYYGGRWYSSGIYTNEDTITEESTLELSYRLNITNVEFILLADPDAEDSEAVVLSTETVMISQQSVMALAVKQMGMFLCRMDSRDTSTLRFIQPFNVSVSMNNNNLSARSSDTTDGQLLTELEIDVDALVLCLSYRDAMLVTSIFNKAYELYIQHISPTLSDKSTSTPSMTSRFGSKSIDNYAKTIFTSAKSEIDNILQLSDQTKESLRASFRGMQIILIEEVHEFPMIDMTLQPFEITASNWSKLLSANVHFSAYANYFNIKNSHWEPLVEPWQFKLEISKGNQEEQPLNIKVLSTTDLNVNISHTFLESAMTTITMFDKQKNLNYCGERGHESPYRLRNRTGYPIHVWNNNENNLGGEVTVKRIEDGKDLPWWFEDWRKRREMTETVSNILNVQLEGALWETLRNAKVDTEGEHIYPLRPLVRNVQHRLVFDVKLVDNVKVVTIRSALMIENRTLLPVDVTLLDSRGYSDGTFIKIAPGDDYPLPIERAYHNRFCIRPDVGFGYKWTSHAIHWSDFTKNDDYQKTISCVSEEGNDMPPFIFQMFARHDKSNALYGHYCAMSIRLSAPVEIENLLPYDFNFRIIDKTAGQDYNSFLRKGGSIPLHVVENKHLLLLNIHMPDTIYSASDFAIISTRGSEDLDIDDTFQLMDRSNNRLTLKINTIDIPESGGARKYSIYCPYIMINKTSLPIAFKPKLAWQNSVFSSQTDFTVCRPATKPEPFMYSYPKYDNRNRSLIQTSGSEWSEPLSFEAVRTVYDVNIPTPSQSEEFHIGVNVQEGQGKYKLTKMVTFTPRFILSNHLNVSIRYREPESRVDQEVEPQSRIPLYRVRKGAEKQLCIKLPGINNVWSSPFNIQDIGKVHVRLDSADGSTTMLMKVTTILEDATIFIVLDKEDDNEWPYLLINQTNENMTFYQENPMTISDSYAGQQYKTNKSKIYTIPPQSEVSYSWDMPAVKDKKIILNINGRERAINPQEIGSQLPFRHMTNNGQQAITSIDIKTHGSCQIIHLFPFSQGSSLFRPASGQSTSSSISRSNSSNYREGSRKGYDEFEAIDVKPVIHAIFQIKLSHIGISVINKQLQELVYVTLKNMDIKMTDSNMYQSLRWNIKWLQIDNQLYGTLFPILLYPTNMTKEAGQEILPTFQLALDRVKDDSHGVLYFKYFSVLLQEMSVEMDEEFIYAVLDFSRLDVNGWNTDMDESNIWEYSTEIPDAKEQDNVSLLYFEVLSVQPIRFDLSFVRTAQINMVDDINQNNSALMFFINILTMAIGNINNAPMRFNALAVENLMASRQDLTDRIFIHYSDQFVYQIHRMLGSADFLGNPVGLFNNLSSGVAELFYEPWQGLIMSDRPQDLGMGIARGFSGFVRKSVFGVTDSFTKFTGSIGKGLSAATMDREYQERRRMNMARNKPRHALVGMAQGANYFANSLASGVTGLVTQPIEGASKEGVGGFFAGVGKGIVGAVTKPVVGVFDLASNVTEGIRNTTTPSDTNDIERIRYPRFIGESGVLKSYNLREAQGQSWLKDVGGGKYFNDAYIAHCHVQDNDRVAMLTSNRLMLLRTRRLGVEWQEPFTDIQTIKCEPTGIAIYLRSMSWEPFLVIPDKRTREWFFKKIEDTVLQYNAARRPMQ